MREGSLPGLSPWITHPVPSHYLPSMGVCVPVSSCYEDTTHWMRAPSVASLYLNFLFKVPSPNTRGLQTIYVPLTGSKQVAVVQLEHESLDYSPRLSDITVLPPTLGPSLTCTRDNHLPMWTIHRYIVCKPDSLMFHFLGRHVTQFLSSLESC